MTKFARTLEEVITYAKELYPGVSIDREAVERWMAHELIPNTKVFHFTRAENPRYSPEFSAQVATVALMIHRGYDEPIIAKARQIALTGVPVEDDYIRGAMEILVSGIRVEKPTDGPARLAQAAQVYAKTLNEARAALWSCKPIGGRPNDN